MASKSTRRESANAANANKVAAVPVANNCSSNPAPAIIGVNAPLPMRFMSIEDAFSARNELKAKLDTLSTLLVENDNIIMSSKGEVYFVKELPVRVKGEIPWLKVSTVEGNTFGFVDPGSMNCDDSLDAQCITIETDGTQISMVFVDLAHVRSNECSDPIERWVVTGKHEVFDRIIGNPYKELVKNLEGVTQAINEMAEKIGK